MQSKPTIHHLYLKFNEELEIPVDHQWYEQAKRIDIDFVRVLILEFDINSYLKWTL
ncbi:hypothetical protein HYE24_00895 [Mycoplasmopsis bovis]|nr:hypothetical protein [Mycoplasmopsis bovis]QQH23621.1 hypothetical protein HYE24_00895 [Mycoplasmopsis bovis]